MDQTKIVSDAMKDKSAQESISKLQDKWKQMSDDLQTLMDEVKDDVDKFKRKMAIITGVCLVVAVVLVAVAAFLSGGTALAAMGPILGTYGTYAVVGLGALTLVGATTFGIILMAEPDILQIIEKSKNDTTNAINDGLSKIAQQADKVETMLQTIYNDWAEITGAVTPSEAGEMSAWGPNVKALAKNLNDTKASIDELIKDIHETEDAVEAELGTYTEKIYKPLLDLYQ